ncbi:Bug family tripartite tricarboxylate transporter substrate binding protein [Malikia spinosa]|uniref:Bug family tripartite tricarboxylate transporter substrate binding protein n=1 Tax=Malikia spinosa TaxID=86180 RepID=UPI003FA27841
MKQWIIAAAAALSLSQVMAWPDKTVSMVVPFPAGGGTDSIARTLAPKLQEKLGGTFIVENKAGATGTIGAGQVSRAAPDGHTLLVTSLGPLVIAPHLMAKVPYDALKDFDYLTVLVQAPNVLVVPANSRFNSLADVIAHHKANPDRTTFASSGNGSSDHLTAELFWMQTGTSGTHVPYKGGGPAMADLLGGQVDASFQNLNVVVPHVKAGKLKPLAITSARRSPLLPNVPTLEESGIKDANVYSWQAVAAPKGLSSDLRSKLVTALRDSINDPQIKTKFIDLGMDIVANTPEQFATFQAGEFARWKKLIEARKITAD